MLNGESAGVPEDIVVDWLLRYPRSATATPRNPFLVWTILLCIAVGVCYIGHNSQIPRERPSLLGAIQVLRNADGGGGCQILWKKALLRCKVQCYLRYEGGGVGV